MKFVFFSVLLFWFVVTGAGAVAGSGENPKLRNTKGTSEVWEEDEVTRQYDLGQKHELFHPVDLLTARDFYRKAAAGGHHEAGRRVQYLNEKLKIFSDLKKQAQAGDTYSQYRLGITYELGIYGPPDIYMALYWLMKAATDGQYEAAYRRYTMLVKRHKVKLEVFDLVKQAQKGDVKSQFDLAFLYEVGGEKMLSHLGSAIYWYRKALAQGHAGAGQRLKLIESSSSFSRYTQSVENCMKTFH